MAALAGCVRVEEYGAGQVVLKAGEVAHCVYVLESGEAVVESELQGLADSTYDGRWCG